MNMHVKKIITFLAVALIIVSIGVGYFLSQKKESQTLAPIQQQKQVDKKSEAQPAPLPPMPSLKDTKTTSKPSIVPQAQIQDPVVAFVSYAVVYTDSGYMPPTLEIKKGDTVTFENHSKGNMWTAAAIHPTHREYPTSGGCIGSTFDSCKNITPGEEWSFMFERAGTWKYHNHTNPSQMGSIIVK